MILASMPTCSTLTPSKRITALLIGRVSPTRVQNSQHIDLTISDQRVHDQIRQSDDRKLPRTVDLSGTA
jgi:hypothetical protein